MKNKKPVKLPTPYEQLSATFSDALRTFARKMTITQMAKDCGVTTRSIQLWMNKQGNPNFATMVGCITILKNYSPKPEGEK